jgi:predicted MFS family arabinose efflux permease
MFAAYVISGMIAAVFPLFATDVLQTSKATVGTLISARTLTQSLGFLLLGAAGFWQFRRRYILLGQLYLALLLAVMTQARSLAAFAVLFPLVGLGMAYSYSSGLFHGITGSRRRAGRMAIHESLLNGGYIVGATAGGSLYQHVSMSAVVLFCLGCSVAALAVQIALLGRFRRRGLYPPPLRQP